MNPVMRAGHGIGWKLSALVSLLVIATLTASGCGSKRTMEKPKGLFTRSSGQAGEALDGIPKVMGGSASLPPRLPVGPNDNPPVDDPVANTEDYGRIVDNAFISAAQQPLSTFSTDVDTASYSNARRFLNEGQLPPKDAVRIEELINYFKYDYAAPKGDDAVSINCEIAECPWNSAHRLLRVGLQARRLEVMPPRNLVFLIDVSGSMNDPKKLPLVQSGLSLLVEQLTKRDSIAIVVYAGSSGLVLPATPGDRKEVILSALNRLQAGGSTNGGQGIQLAYRVCQEHFIKNAVNRVILATDGDFNVGITDRRDLITLIEEKRQTGICLTVLGFGMGNLKDATLEQLADKGDGQYAYIDTLQEARKVFVEDGAALATVAKDVKLQLEFNPRQVASYRLVGYENRLLRNRDFADDQKDAGDMGAGHTVTTLYELVPHEGDAGTRVKLTSGGKQSELKYAKLTEDNDTTGELVEVRIRYKEPDEAKSKLVKVAVCDAGTTLSGSSPDFKFAAAVAEFGLLLRDSPHKANARFGSVLELARQGRGADDQGHRAAFVQMVESAEVLAARR